LFLIFIRAQFNELQSVAKILALSPNDDGAAKQVTVLVEKIEAELQQMVKDVEVISAPVELRSAAKQLAGRGLELSATAAKYLYSDKDLMGKLTTVNNSLTPLLETVKNATLKPTDTRLQEKLAAEIRAVAAPMAQIVAAIKRNRNLPPEADQDISTVLGNTQAGLQRVMAAINKTENAAKSSADVSEAVDKLNGNSAQLDALEFSAVRGILSAPSGQTREGAVELLDQFAETLTNSVEQLVRLADATAPLAPPAKAAAESMSDMVMATELLAGIIPKEGQGQLFTLSKNLNKEVIGAIGSVQEARKQKGKPEVAESLRQSRQSVRKSVADFMAYAKGMNNDDLDEAVSALKSEVDKVSVSETLHVPKNNRFLF
jgi:hypothetical protein